MVITGEQNIVNNLKQRQLLTKGPKYRQAQPINWNQNFKFLMDYVEDYAKRWTKREKVETDTLSEWVKSVRSSIKSRIRRLRVTMSTKTENIFHDPNVRAA